MRGGISLQARRFRGFETGLSLADFDRKSANVMVDRFTAIDFGHLGYHMLSEPHVPMMYENFTRGRPMLPSERGALQLASMPYPVESQRLPDSVLEAVAASDPEAIRTAHNAVAALSPPSNKGWSAVEQNVRSQLYLDGVIARREHLLDAGQIVYDRMRRK